MQQPTLSGPEIALFAGTRVALGIGIGLLVAGKLSHDHRKGAGIALTVTAALTTIPLAVQVITRAKAGDSKLLSVA
ncbi:MAG TPA: hypothetical protein VFP59_16820 [Candidatus Angelobacter sp.]|nr:hypothetical protein [Candidatus Angelobacter sp.]